MPDPRRSVEVELQWLVSVYSPKIIKEISALLSTALEACGTDLTQSNQVNHLISKNNTKSLFPITNLTLHGHDKDVFCYVAAAGDKILKVSLHILHSEWNRGNQIIVESNSNISIIMEQIFNSGGIVSLALEQLRCAFVPESATIDCFARTTFISKLNDVRRLLTRSIQQLIDVDKQNIFPYTVFDSAAYNNAPDDLVIEYFVQSGKLCANVYIVSQTSHQNPSHIRQKSTVSQPSAAATGSNLSQNSSSYYFYNGSPVEILYHTHLEAIFPSAVTALTSIENALGLLEDLCLKIDCIQKLCHSDFIRPSF